MPIFPPSQQRTRVIGPHERKPVPERVPDATAGNLLRRYRPLETRATGGFGSVEICLDARLQRRVAIKRIPLTSPDVRTTAETVADALAEARTASMLQHPNIVSVIDFTYDTEYAYLVMEYVDGMNLEEFLAAVDGHSLTYDEAACIADALVQALTFAHENGVLHLDIKPANVLIDRNGHVKLADFGMASLTSAAGFGGARGGTIGYMPSEQLRGDAVDERTDIFALAAVLYEALCATAPFRAGTPADSEKRIEEGVLYPSDLLPDIPENTEEALLVALSPDPRGRMESAAAFGDLLLPGLGHAREGRRSLAALIARLTSDEEDADDAEPQGRIVIDTAASETGLPFTDVAADDWFFDAVKAVYEAGLMGGVSDTEFAPDVNMNRAMLVTMLYRLEGSPEVETAVSDVFTDCADGEWYADAVIWANANGIVEGRSETEFAPNDTMTRQEMAAILYRYEVFKGAEEVEAAELEYADADAIADWAESAVVYCTDAGLMSGVSDTEFAPAGSATRAMGATVLMRLAA